MDNNLIIIKILINKVLFKPVLINIGYKYYSIVNKDIIMELRLPRVKIPFKLIISFMKKNIKEPWVEITEIVKFFINI